MTEFYVKPYGPAAEEDNVPAERPISDDEAFEFAIHDPDVEIEFLLDLLYVREPGVRVDETSATSVVEELIKIKFWKELLIDFVKDHYYEEIMERRDY